MFCSSCEIYLKIRTRDWLRLLYIITVFSKDFIFIITILSITTKIYLSFFIIIIIIIIIYLQMIMLNKIIFSFSFYEKIISIGSKIFE